MLSEQVPWMTRHMQPANCIRIHFLVIRFAGDVLVTCRHKSVLLIFDNGGCVNSRLRSCDDFVLQR